MFRTMIWFAVTLGLLFLAIRVLCPFVAPPSVRQLAKNSENDLDEASFGEYASYIAYGGCRLCARAGAGMKKAITNASDVTVGAVFGVFLIPFTFVLGVGFWALANAKRLVRMKMYEEDIKQLLDRINPPKK